MRLSGPLSILLTMAMGLVAASHAAQGKDKNKKSPGNYPEDSIEVVGHIQLGNGTVTHFVTTQHYSRSYLYVEHEGGKNVTLIDVSDPAHPSVLGEIPSAPNRASESLLAVTGTAAIVTDHSANETAAAPQTIRIIDFRPATAEGRPRIPGRYGTEQG